MNKNVRILLSSSYGHNLEHLNAQQIANLSRQIKKQSTYLLFNANRALQAKDDISAKRILLYLADACSIFGSSDEQINQILIICCEYLAVIQKKQQKQKIKRNTSILRSSSKKKTNIIVLKYNKYSGQLKFEDCDKQIAKNQNLAFYLTKLNSILFSNQNIENQHPITVISKSYSYSFLLSFLLIFLLFGTFLLHLLLDTNSCTEYLSFLPLILVGISFIIPLLIIYLKKPFQKDTHFFQIKLVEQIQKINSQCRRNGKKIQFLMPQGLELNIKIDQQQIKGEIIQRFTLTDSLYMQHNMRN